MKLKKVLFLSFLVLTFIPVAILSVMLYTSGYELSKQSYTQNLTESINVQADYISQSFEADLIADLRFAGRVLQIAQDKENSQSEVLAQFRNYLEASEDKISICTLVAKDGSEIYTIGESEAFNMITSQLPKLSELENQEIVEFSLGENEYSLGIVTPVINNSGEYLGSMVTVFNKAYIFKIISSYYEITDASTYICRADGTITSSRGVGDEAYNLSVAKMLDGLNFDGSNDIDAKSEDYKLIGYYREIYNSPWYLVGIVNEAQIMEFLNKFVWVYILIIAVVFVADIVLAAYFSGRVVKPINSLIKVMDGYPESLKQPQIVSEQGSYYETRYLNEKFLKLMDTIERVQHNYMGVYRLYQSSTMNDTNIEINTIDQTITGNKELFESLMSELPISPQACIVEHFANCFCDKDRDVLMDIFRDMRDKHLSVTREAEIFTPHFGQKWFHVLIVPTYEASRLFKLFIQLRDVSSFKKQEMESTALAMRDPLTGLYNRGGFIESVSSVLKEAHENETHALLFLDINDFKIVNDSFGHSKGDELLRDVSRVLEESVRATDIVSRFGGDEFAVFIKGITHERLLNVTKTLTEKLKFNYVKADNNPIVISVSVGSAIWSISSGKSLDDVLQEADSEMYNKKRKSKQQTKN